MVGLSYYILSSLVVVNPYMSPSVVTTGVLLNFIRYVPLKLLFQPFTLYKDVPVFILDR